MQLIPLLRDDDEWPQLMHDGIPCLVWKKNIPVTSSPTIGSNDPDVFYRKAIQDAEEDEKRMNEDGQRMLAQEVKEFFGKMVDDDHEDDEKKHHHESDDVIPDLTSDLSELQQQIDLIDRAKQHDSKKHLFIAFLLQSLLKRFQRDMKKQSFSSSISASHSSSVSFHSPLSYLQSCASSSSSYASSPIVSCTASHSSSATSHSIFLSSASSSSCLQSCAPLPPSSSPQLAPSSLLPNQRVKQDQEKKFFDFLSTDRDLGWNVTQFTSELTPELIQRLHQGILASQGFIFEFPKPIVRPIPVVPVSLLSSPIVLQPENDDTFDSSQQHDHNILYILDRLTKRLESYFHSYYSSEDIYKHLPLILRKDRDLYYDILHVMPDYLAFRKYYHKVNYFYRRMAGIFSIQGSGRTLEYVLHLCSNFYHKESYSWHSVVENMFDDFIHIRAVVSIILLPYISSFEFFLDLAALEYDLKNTFR